MKLQEIKDEIDNYYDINISDKSRKLEYIEGRCIFYDLALHFNPVSFRYARVGKALNKHHATVMHGLKTFESLYMCDSNFRKNYQILKDKIKLKIDSIIEIEEELEKENKMLVENEEVKNFKEKKLIKRISILEDRILKLRSKLISCENKIKNLK